MRLVLNILCNTLFCNILISYYENNPFIFMFFLIQSAVIATCLVNYMLREDKCLCSYVIQGCQFFI